MAPRQFLSFLELNCSSLHSSRVSPALFSSRRGSTRHGMQLRLLLLVELFGPSIVSLQLVFWTWHLQRLQSRRCVALCLDSRASLRITRSPIQVECLLFSSRCSGGRRALLSLFLRLELYGCYLLEFELILSWSLLRGVLYVATLWILTMKAGLVGGLALLGRGTAAQMAGVFLFSPVEVRSD